MRRTSLAPLLAFPLLLAWNPPAGAHYPQQCSYGFGCGGMCLNLFSKLHQHGPLFNYGPYYGYPPFEPYGPWNAYLQYNPWYYGDPNAGRRGLLHGHHGKCGIGCRLHAHWSNGGWFRGDGCLGCGLGGGNLAGRLKCKLCGHKASVVGDCPSCASAPAAPVQTDPAKTDPVTRYSGIGSPEEFAGFYDQLPSIRPTVVPAGY